MKEGQKLFCDFLKDLSFNDYVGMVSYDTYARMETVLNTPGMPSVNISAQPLGPNYDALKTIIHHKQAGHYYYATNMGGGLKQAKAMLDQHSRAGAKPTILLMTDGQANAMDSGDNANLPSNWNWNTLFDYDGDGVADYTTTNTHKRYVLKYAKQCVDNGYTIHGLAVGSGADRDLMKAICHLGRGIYIDVPGGTSVSQMEAEIKEAYNRIASFVPPARLLNPE